MIDLELYRIFKIVADEENLTKASEILKISQPAVTKHIRNLENELNVQLFKRSKYGMILNENGKLINVSTFPVNIPYCILACSKSIYLLISFTIVNASMVLFIADNKELKEIGIATQNIVFIIVLIRSCFCSADVTTSFHICFLLFI